MSVQDDELHCFCVNADHQCLRHGGCHIQEARQGPRILGHGNEGGLTAFTLTGASLNCPYGSESPVTLPVLFR